jgi:hemoglobin
MYPADLGPARQRMTAFLAQYWGGPGTTASCAATPAADAARPFRTDADTRDR